MELDLSVHCLCVVLSERRSEGNFWEIYYVQYQRERVMRSCEEILEACSAHGKRKEVKVTREQATKSQRGSKSIAVLFL